MDTTEILIQWLLEHVDCGRAAIHFEDIESSTTIKFDDGAFFDVAELGKFLDENRK